jgi:hypothetical protein
MKEINSDNDLDQLFQDKLGEQTMAPSKKLWPGITAELDKDPRKPVIIYWLIGGFALLLLSGGIWMFAGKGATTPSDNKILTENTLAPLTTNSGTENNFSSNTSTDLNNTKKESSTSTDVPGNTPSGQHGSDRVNTTNTPLTNNPNNTPTLIPDHSGNSSGTDRPHTTDHPKDPPVKNNTHSSSSGNDKHTTSQVPTHIETPEMKSDMTEENELDNTSRKDNVPAPNNNKQSSGNTNDNGQQKTPESDLNNNQQPTTTNEQPVTSNQQPSSNNQQPAANNQQQTNNQQPKKDSLLVQDPNKDSVNTLFLLDTTKIIRVTQQPPVQEPFMKFYVSGFYGIDINKQSLKPATQQGESNGFQYYYPAYTSDPANTWSAGLRFGGYITRRFSLEGQVSTSFITPSPGRVQLRFYHLQPHTLNIYTTFGSVSVPSDTFNLFDHTGAPSDTFRINVSISENYRLINLPVCVRFNMINNKYLKLYARGGIAASYIYKQELKLAVERSGKVLKYTSVDGLSPFNLSMVFGLGLEARIYKGVGIWTEPGMMYTATSVTRTPGMKNRPYSYTIPFGLIFHF